MAEYFVSTTNELLVRISLANPGDTIYLAPGTYDPILVRDLGGLGLTIASQDPDDPAILTGFRMRGGGDVRFSNLVFSAEAEAHNAFEFSGVDNVTFSGIEMYGPDNIGSGSETSPFIIRNSSNITVVDSEFHHVRHAIQLLDVDGLVISGNDFHDIRVDGIRGGGVNNAVIHGNTFTDFFPAENDHPDAIQLWSTNQDTAARNITITDNYFERGDGDPIQGIFIRDTFHDLPFQNITITGNVILGGLYNGIAVAGLIGGEISGNVVIGYPDQRSWIRLSRDVNVDVSGNAATYYQLDDAHLGGNRLISENVDFYSDIVAGWEASGGDLSQLATDLIRSAVYADNQSENDVSYANEEYTTVAGTQGNDELVAGNGGSRVDGFGGNDLLHGGVGNDLLVGHRGNDVLIGNDGDDSIYGGFGRDTLRGGSGNDTLFGGSGDDELVGGIGNDFLFGEMSPDKLVGGAGHDRLFGGLGNDVLLGGDGDDLLFGGWGDDQLIGGDGKDRFVFHGNNNGADAILDFVHGDDVISLYGIDAIEGTARNDRFTFIDDAAFSGTAGELRLEHVANGVMVLGDMDGDGVADFSLIVEGVDDLTANDFIF